MTPTLEEWRFAKEHGFGAVAEFGFWVDNIDELLASGLAGPDTVLDHCAGLTDEQWTAVAGCGAAVVLVPRSDPHYGLGAVTPVRATNRNGIQEAISSDNEFEYGLDLFTEMRTLMIQGQIGTRAARQGGHDGDLAGTTAPGGVAHRRRRRLRLGGRRRHSGGRRNPAKVGWRFSGQLAVQQ